MTKLTNLTWAALWRAILPVAVVLWLFASSYNAAHAEEKSCPALRELESLIAEWDSREILHPSKLEALKKVAQAFRDCEGSRSTEAGSRTFTGRWYTDYGVMDLTQTGARVAGTYDQNQGEIQGEVVENVLKGKWAEAPSYSEPEDKGDFELVLSEDGKSFRGKWRNGSEGDWQYDWNGERE